MTSEDDEDQFYSSFYELNNGEIIELLLFQNKDHKHYDFTYAKTKFKSGKLELIHLEMQRLMMRKKCLKSFLSGFIFFQIVKM